MQWIKSKVGVTNNRVPDRQNFTVGSDKWIGSARNPSSPSTPVAPLGSFKNPESAQSAMQTYKSQPNPYVMHNQEPASDKNDEASAKSLTDEISSKPGRYPNVSDNAERKQAAAESKDAGSDEEDEEILTGAQVLLTIPGAIVHLIDDEESIHLATGDFSLVRLVQETMKVAVIAKVGEELKWPLVQEEPTVKLDPTHYFFSLKVPKDIDEEPSSSKARRNSLETDVATEVDTLNYGLTFPAGSADEQTARIRDLDYFLERYSMFSAPIIVQGDAKEGSKEREALEKLRPQDRSFPGKVIPAETVSGDGAILHSEENSAAFWTTIAPNVGDYNSKLAKGIASGAGQIIKGIFWFSDSTVAQLDSGHMFMKSKFKPKNKKTKVSPVTMGSVRRVRKLSGMTDKVTGGVLGGVLYTTGMFSSAVVNSTPGKTFFKLLPGEVALVSLDAFGKVFDAIEKAGKNVLVRSSSVTQDFVNYRYGEAAKELTDESLRTAGHVFSTAWTVTKIRKALNPNKLKVSKTGIAKSLAKSAVGATKKA